MGFLWTSRKKNQLNRIYRLKDIQETRIGIESEIEKNTEKREKKIRTLGWVLTGLVTGDEDEGGLDVI